MVDMEIPSAYVQFLRSLMPRKPRAEFYNALGLAKQGKTPTDEIAALPLEIDMFHVEPLAVPGLDAERCLVWMRRRGAA